MRPGRGVVVGWACEGQDRDWASWPDACRLIEQYVAAGISKFVIRPAASTQDPEEFLEHFVRELMPLQT